MRSAMLDSCARDDLLSASAHQTLAGDRKLTCKSWPRTRRSSCGHAPRVPGVCMWGGTATAVGLRIAARVSGLEVVGAAAGGAGGRGLAIARPRARGGAGRVLRMLC
jgi:hypothetical protein